MYTGDSNFVSVTSSVVSQVVTDLTIDVASGGTPTATVSAGGTATYNLTIAPATGSVMPAVTLSASGAPTGSTVTITPQTISAGAGATNVTVAVQVPAATAAVRRTSLWALGFALPGMGLLVLPFRIGSRRGYLKRARFPVLLLIALVSIGTLFGCGGSSRTTPQPHSTNYTITVTATSGSVSHSTSLTLTVQ